MAESASADFDGADYAGHYALHGRQANGMFAHRKRSTGQKVLSFLGNMALNYAANNGNYGAQLALRQRALANEDRRKSQAEFAEHSRIVGTLMRQGLTADQAELAALDPKAVGTEYNSRFRTREVSPEQTVYTPGMGGGQASTWTAPKIFENGPQRVQVDPNTGTHQVLFTGKTDAGWAAEESGYQPGTKGYTEFMRDKHLGAYGPTAGQMNDARLAQSNTNNVRSTSTSAANAELAAQTSRQNRANTPVGTVLNERGEVVVAYPDNRVTTLRGSKPVSTGRGRAGRGAGGVPDGTVIRNPQTGQTMVRRGGRWVAQ
jgi:hypothetical protein